MNATLPSPHPGMHAVPPASSPLRILHCIPSVWSGSGGPTRAVIELARATMESDEGCAVDIVSTDFGLTPTWRTKVESLLPAGSRLHIFPETRGLDAGWSVPLVRWLWDVLPRYDVLHVHSLFSTLTTAAAWMARRRGVPYVVLPHGTLSPYTFANRRRWLKRGYFAAVDRRTVEGAAVLQFTAPQEAIKASRLGLEVRTQVVPLPYTGAITRLRAPADAPEGRPGGERVGDRGGRGPRILFLSRLHPVKGLDLLLPAFGSVRAEFPDAELVLAGAGDPAYEQDLREAAAPFGASVQFAGFVEGSRKAALLAEADVFVLPSYQENFGVAVTEALAAERPVVITREVDLWPDVERYGAGVVVDATVESVARGILQVLSAPGRGAGIGANGARQVQDLYAPEVVGAQLVALYRSLRPSTPPITR